VQVKHFKCKIENLDAMMSIVCIQFEANNGMVSVSYNGRSKALCVDILRHLMKAVTPRMIITIKITQSEKTVLSVVGRLAIKLESKIEKIAIYKEACSPIELIVVAL